MSNHYSRSYHDYSNYLQSARRDRFVALARRINRSLTDLGVRDVRVSVGYDGLTFRRITDLPAAERLADQLEAIQDPITGVNAGLSTTGVHPGQGTLF